MARAAKVCGHQGCAQLAPCPEHRTLPWAGSTRRTRTISGSRQQKRSKRVLMRAGGLCAVCGVAMATEADHTIPLAEGGADDVSNMQAICKPCHKAKTQGEAKRGRTAIPEYRHSTAPFLIALVGGPGTGKTQIARALATERHIPYRSIDDCGPRGARGQRWATMFAWVAQQQGCALTESNIVPPPYARLLNRTPHCVIEVIAPDHVRRERLDERGDSDWALTTHPIGYPPDITIYGGIGATTKALEAIDQLQEESAA